MLTERWSKLQRALRSISRAHLKMNSIIAAHVDDVRLPAAKCNMLKPYVVPDKRKMRDKMQSFGGFFSADAEHSTNDGADHHRRRPDLVWRRGAEPFVVAAGENLGHTSKRTIEGEQRIRK